MTSLPSERRVRRFTADEVLRMVDAGVLGEDEPLELLDGELVVVTPQGPPHAGTTTHLRDIVSKAYRGESVVLAEGERAELPGTKRALRARDFLP